MAPPIVTTLDDLLSNPRVTLESPLSDIRGVSESTAAEYAREYPDDTKDADWYGPDPVRTIQDLFATQAAIEHPVVPYQWRAPAALDVLTTEVTPEDVGLETESDLAFLRYTTATGHSWPARRVPSRDEISTRENHSGSSGCLWRTIPEAAAHSQPATVFGPIESDSDEYVFFTTASSPEALLDPAVRDAETYTRVETYDICVASLLFRRNYAKPVNQSHIRIRRAGEIASELGHTEEDDHIVVFDDPNTGLSYASRTTQTTTTLLDQFLREQVLGANAGD